MIRARREYSVTLVRSLNGLFLGDHPMRPLACSFVWIVVASISVVGSASDDQPVVVTALAEAAISGEPAAELDETLAAGESDYSLTIDFEATWWDRFYPAPDLFAVIESEGGRRFLIPEIEPNWDYSRKIFNFRCPTLNADSRGVVRLYDSDATSNHIWTQVLSSRISWDASATATAGPPGWLKKFACVELNAGAGGELQLLDPSTGESLIINAPDPIAAAEFTVPPANGGQPWELQGVFMSGSRERGTVAFRHWQTRRRSLLSSAPASAPWWLAIGTIVTIAVAVSGFALRRQSAAVVTNNPPMSTDSHAASNEATDDFSSPFADSGVDIFAPSAAMESPSIDESPAASTPGMFDPD